ncbi:NAD-dependent epimerase/dehydratase family protein [Salinarimonas rosea]|uniref:NAD-dependent epimerase/dehydratase family protein n=1 Tax=Salinarimonas rosea TaxID=552063 RepID=UPI00048DEE90|nr:NAD(P)-dependent oxidoreductase [Salinarimonas rosea]
MPPREKFLVTGAMGCLGAWVLRHLRNEGAAVVAADLSSDPVRPRLLMSDEELQAIDWLILDITDAAAVNRTVSDHEITHIVHLAGLQIPFCKANPALGAAVNVVGTINVLEAVRHNGVSGLAYASSLAALGPPQLYERVPVEDDAPTAPSTLYGVYKVTNEETARLYWTDWRVGSIGLRPYNVFGVGRDQGLTADVAKAILAVAAGEPFHIRYGGPLALQHASDVAEMFIAAARLAHQGAAVVNVRNDVTTVEAFVDLLSELYPHAQITNERGNLLPFPADLDDAGLRRLIGDVPHVPLTEAIRQDVEQYRSLLKTGRLDLEQLSL